MSEIVTASAAVASQAAVGTIVAPAVAVGACAALGYALTQAPFWKGIEGTVPDIKEPDGTFYSVQSLQSNFVETLERNYERLLLLPSVKMPAPAMETLASVMSLKTSPVIAATASEHFSEEFKGVLNQVGRLQEMSEAQIETLNRRTAALLERSLAASQSRLHSHVVREFRSAVGEVGWVIKDEASSGRGSAFLAVNRSGQSLAAHVDADGSITTDLSGFSGRSCEAASKQIFDALERRGIRLNQKKEQPHYLFQGGAVINGVSRAEQVLANAEKHESKLRKTSPKVNASSVSPNGDAKNRTRKAHVINRLRSVNR